jgi:integrase/recombinase XerD
MRQSASFFNRSRIVISFDTSVGPLLQCMTDDMRIRKLAPKTQAANLRVVREFARFLGRSPATAAEGLRGHQLNLVDHGTLPISLDAAIGALKFFFESRSASPN